MMVCHPQAGCILIEAKGDVNQKPVTFYPSGLSGSYVDSYRLGSAGILYLPVGGAPLQLDNMGYGVTGMPDKMFCRHN